MQNKEGRGKLNGSENLTRLASGDESECILYNGREKYSIAAVRVFYKLLNQTFRRFSLIF